MANSITYPNGKRVMYDEYGSFSDAFEVVRNINRDNDDAISWLSYYDRYGDTHKVIYILKTIRTGSGMPIEGMMINGQHIARLSEASLHDTAAKYVRLERSDEFCGWSL